MINMGLKMVIPIIFILLFIPSALALNAVPAYNTSCIDSIHIQKIANITDRQDSSKILDSVQTVACPYGCDQNRNICWKWPANALSGEYFIIFELIAVFLMFFSLWRLDVTEKDIKIFDIVIPIFAFILFTLLALQGNNVIDLTTGEGIPMTMVVWLNYGLGLLMLIFFFFSLFKFARAVTEQGSGL